MRSRIGIKTRLLAVAIVPTVALVVVAAQGALHRRDTVRGAKAISDAADQLGRLVRLRFVLSSEQASTETLLRSKDFHFADEQLNAYVGYDVKAALAEARAQATATAADLGSFGDSVLGDLRTLRTGVDGIELSVPGYHAQADALDERVAIATHDAIDALRTPKRSAAGHADVERAVDALVDLGEMVEGALRQHRALADLVLADEPHRAQAIVALSAASAEVVESSEALRESADPGLRRYLRMVDGDEHVRLVDRAVRAVLDPTAPRDDVPLITDVDGTAKVFSAALARQRLLDGALSRAHGQLGIVATITQARAASAFRRNVIIVGLVVIAALGWALVNAWLLSRPLRRLAGKVATIGRGELASEPGTRLRLREAAIVERALVDLVENMRIVERQTKALAAGRVTDPILSRPVPGAIGRSLQDSVARLSQSIARERELRERLEHEATHDALTALPSRAAAMAHIERELAAARRAETAVALLFVDLDDFKKANDGHGHAVGDDVLRKVASSFVAIVRAGDLVARLGGDEFVIVTTDPGDGAAAVELARRVVAQTALPMVVDDHRFVIGASVGVAIARDGAVSAEELLKHADVAVYRAKTKGKGRVELFDETMQRELEERAEIEAALTNALANDELEVHYQPIVYAGTGRPAGVEALVRWRRDEHGMVPPGAFIPIAELSGRIIDIGRVVLRKSACEVARWAELLGVDGLKVSVNVSGRHVLSGSLIDDVRAALAVSELDPRQLTLEITETVLLTDLPMVGLQLEELRAMGVRVAIDDFGTGYTSLSHLRQLPADIIKIDGSFVAHLDEPREATLVRLVNDLGHSLGLRVVAEGVETDRQRAQLADLGCDLLQGYYFSRPLPAEDVRHWLADRFCRTSNTVEAAAGSDQSST